MLGLLAVSAMALLAFVGTSMASAAAFRRALRMECPGARANVLGLEPVGFSLWLQLFMLASVVMVAVDIFKHFRNRPYSEAAQTAET